MSLFPFSHKLISRVTGDPADQIETVSVGRATVYADFDDEETAAILPESQAAIFYRLQGERKLKVAIVMVDEFRQAAGEK